jgi:hypothetical protein
MPPTRKLRWAQVEYQPNLQVVADPVPLGVVVEELRSGGRHLVIIGREPRRAIPGLQLEDAWGPFLDVVTNWVETFGKSAREFIDQVQPQEYALDELAKRWRWNVYLREPQSRAVNSTVVALDEYARRWYEEYVGDPFPRLPSGRTPPSKAVRRRQQPWLARTNLLQAATA